MSRLLLFPHRRELVDNRLYVGRDRDGWLEVQSEIWREVGRDGDWGIDAAMVSDAPRRETVRRIMDGAVLYRVVADLLCADRLADRDIEPAAEVLARLAPEMVEDFLTAHQDQRAGQQRQIDSSRAPERERREDSAGWLLMKWVEEAEGATRPVPAVILHIPHASRVIPDDLRPTLLLDDEALARELIAMTDSHADRLFATTGEVATVTFPVSRLVLDPERFTDDTQEPMAARGMGAIYERTSEGAPLRRPPTSAEREALLARFYRPHHDALTAAVDAALAAHGHALLLDCHSFPSTPRPYELDPMTDRPDICLGTDPVHTPPWLIEAARLACERAGWTVALDRPYAGTIVPSAHYRTEPRVRSLMIEVNRRLYMDEVTGEPSDRFAACAEGVRRVIEALMESMPE